MSDPIAARLASLPKLSKTDLHDLWKDLFQKSPPPRLRKDLMIPILGYRLQESSLAALRVDARRRVSTLARAIETDASAGIVSSPSIKTGTGLVRQWLGKVHIVHLDVRRRRIQRFSYLLRRDQSDLN
jgi:Protein of unknown function (DUF2924)